jgi:methionyl-tRNA formyltransferase
MNIVLAAEESAGLQMLRSLAASRHRLVGVFAEPPKDGTAGSVWNVATNLGLETRPARQLKDGVLSEWLRSEQVDIFLNIHSLYLVHPQVLAAPKLGAFNLHPGPLPRYAGLNAVSWAIFRGEQEHAVTVHRMDPEIDAGPIVYQTRFPIEAGDTALSLSFKCVREGVALMQRLLSVAEKGDVLPLSPQDLAVREYFGREVPEQGQLSWSWPAYKVVNFVRACDYFPFTSPWGHPRTRRGAQEFALVKASRTGQPCGASPGTVGDAMDSGVQVACQDEWVLASKLQVSGTYLPAAGFLRPGDRLASS